MSKRPALNLDLIVVGFVEALRAAGLDVPAGATVLFGRALQIVGVAEHDDVYWAARSTLLTSPEDVAVFDAVFAQYWLGRRATGAPLVVDHEQLFAADQDDGDFDADGEDSDEPTQEGLVLRWSPSEILRRKDFAAYTDAELDEAYRLMTQLKLRAATRSSRRQRKSHSKRGRLDLARTVKAALRTDGEPILRPTTTDSVTPRRLILLLDVSGSMEPYARALLRFAHAAIVSRRRVEAFAFGTRLTRLTRELQSKDPDAAMRAATAAVPDWSGGTRLGTSLAEFNGEWGLRGMARGAVVVVMSDGWDRGGHDELDEALQRLSRVVHRLVWVNPLKATEGYEPLAGGMATALPYLDEFVEGHNIESLDQLVTAVAA